MYMFQGSALVGSGCKSQPRNGWKAHPCMCQCQSDARADGAVGNCLAFI